jgi:hypothetical protein
LDLEHHRKDAKRLLRGVRAGATNAVARAAAVLGERIAERFQLSDAQHVIARELGYRTWAELKHSHAPAALETADPPRIETTVDTGLQYRPGDPVLVRVVRRGGRTTVSDCGAAFARAGGPTAWREAARNVERELEVNFNRSGSISLPVVAVGPPAEGVVERIGKASLAFHQELLELN